MEKEILLSGGILSLLMQPSSILRDCGGACYCTALFRVAIRTSEGNFDWAGGVVSSFPLLCRLVWIYEVPTADERSSSSSSSSNPSQRRRNSSKSSRLPSLADSAGLPRLGRVLSLTIVSGSGWQEAKGQNARQSARTC